ncbi:hypothetical protein FQN54_007452 [Arachnomyces sp. PD_36]|nr:hypothetical protein FQN54_007452 [Arachnomyces sp. PD_36]
MAQVTSYLADLSLSVDMDPCYEMGDKPIEIDSAVEDAVDSDLESHTGNSIKSSRSVSDEDVIEDVFENGRRYCNSVYFMPNDEPEQTRLSILHQIYLIILDGKLTKAPIKENVKRILDVGTGPGDWAFAIGEQYPNAEVIATDISVFDDAPDGASPPNVSLEIDDAEGEWVHQEPFDLIHFRGLSGAFSDWPAIYQQAFAHLKPGGYIEVTEFDLAADRLRTPNAPTNSYLSIYVSAIRSAAEAAGYPRNLEHLRPTALSAAGFEKIQTHDIDVPVGTWPDDPLKKTLGKMTLICLLEGLEALALRQLTRREGWTAESVRDLCDKVKTEMVSEKGATDTVRFVVARKPLVGIGSSVRRKRKPRKKKVDDGNKEDEGSAGNEGLPNGDTPDSGKELGETMGRES